MVLNVKEIIIERLGTGTESSRASALQVQRKIDRLVAQNDEDLSRDGALPSALPFAILDAMVEPYFATINPHFPIWTKHQFDQMATALRRSEVPERDLASTVCCNNLVLISLTSNCLSSRQGRPSQSRYARKTSAIDFDVVKSFLKSAKRAVENVDQLLAPRLINVQALLSLVRVPAFA